LQRKQAWFFHSHAIFDSENTISYEALVGGKHQCVLAFENMQSVDVGVLFSQLPIQAEFVQAAISSAYIHRFVYSANTCWDLNFLKLGCDLVIAVDSCLLCCYLKVRIPVYHKKLSSSTFVLGVFSLCGFCEYVKGDSFL
jgi:hypothetical protein